MSDGGTQYQSKLLDLVYTYLDIQSLRTTPGHPPCNGQSEVTVKTTKGMIRAYIDEDQEKWDLNLEKYAYAYNSSVHTSIRQTPFEMMFCRKPKIPIDLILPNTEVHDREPILKEFQVSDENLGTVTVLADHPDLPRPIIPALAEKYLKELQDRMEDSHRKAAQNRDLAMDKSKLYHDRNIKKFSYEVGEYVLVDHPHLKKGLSRGIAHKYYGPFIIKKRRDNEVDYYIQRAGKKRGRIYQIHQNRLKAYRMHSDLERQIKEESSSEEDDEPRRKQVYKKNLSNPRWNKENPTTEPSEEEDNGPQETVKKRKYTKKSSKPQERSDETSDSDTTSYDSEAITMEKASQGVDQDAYQNDQIRTNSEDSEPPELAEAPQSVTIWKATHGAKTGRKSMIAEELVTRRSTETRPTTSKQAECKRRVSFADAQSKPPMVEPRKRRETKPPDRLGFETHKR